MSRAIPVQDSNLYREILARPVVPAPHKANTLNIVSGYASFAMSRSVLQDEKLQDVKINLIVGMTSRDGISPYEHEGFMQLSRENPDRFSCCYISRGKPPVHSKVYVWCDQTKPLVAYTGSANYTYNAFYGRQREFMAPCDAMQGMAHFHKIGTNSLPCMEADVDVYSKTYEERARITLPGEKPVQGLESKSVSLLIAKGSSKGRVGDGSRLNWGLRTSDGYPRNPDQAYVAIPSSVYRTDFFPARKENFMLCTDDGDFIECHRSQDAGKALHTADNTVFGRYFRKRLGLKSGDAITAQHLRDYGRTDVTFYKISDEMYYMDFSV